MKSLLLLGMTMASVMGLSTFAENRFRDMQLRLHRQYGYGLRGLAVKMDSLRG